MHEESEDDRLPHRWETWDRVDGGYANLAHYVAPNALRGLGLAGSREETAADEDIAEHLYELLRDRHIEPALEPWVVASGTQEIRDPRLLLQDGVGSCIDLASTYAAMCLEAKVGVLLAITENHAFVILTPGRLNEDARPHTPIELDGFTQNPYEEAGVLVGAPGSLEAALASGALMAVNSICAVDGSLDFDGARASGCEYAMHFQLHLIDIPYLQMHKGFEPFDPTVNRPSIHLHVPADDGPFVPYDSHQEMIEALRGEQGTVVLLGQSGQGKSTIARHLARKAPLGAGWFLDASEPQILIKSLAEMDLAEQNEPATDRARPDREGYAQNALARLIEVTDPWIVVLDNADGDPGKIERLMPTPSKRQLVLITSTNEEWADVPGVVVRRLPAIDDAEVMARRAGEDSDVSALVELIDGRPLLLRAFRSLMSAANLDAATIAASAPSPVADPRDPLRGPAALWAALRESPGFGDRELRLSAYAAHLPPDRQPLDVLEALEPGAREAARLLVDRGLFTFDQRIAVAHDEDHVAVGLHRLFGAAIRNELQTSEPRLLDEVVRRITSERAPRELLDVRGDLDTIDRLEARLTSLEEAAVEPDASLGVALHGVAGLLELHAQTRRSGDVYARAERHLGERSVLLADCRHGRARTVNQHHAKDEALLREAVEWARSARQILIDAHGAEANADRCLAMEGLLMQKLAAFPRADQTELDLLKSALVVIEDADKRRNRRTDVDEAELARSHFNLAGIRIKLAQQEPARAEAHLDEAHAVYRDVAKRRRKLYGRDIHPHIAACVIGLAYVNYYRALLVPASHRQRSAWLRNATDRAVEALKQRETLEGSLDLDEVAKCAAFLAKVALARGSAPVAPESLPTGIFKDAMKELTNASIVLESVARLPSQRAKLPEAIELWVRSPALRVLVAEFGGEMPREADLDDLLRWLEEFSGRWDYRAGKERNLVATPQFTPVARKVVLAAAEALGLTGSDVSTEGRYDHVLILGGLVRGCLARPLYAAKLLRDGSIDADAVTALGGFRRIAGDEVGLVERVVGAEVSDEFHAMRRRRASRVRTLRARR